VSDRPGLFSGLLVIGLGLLAVVGGTFIATGENGNAIQSWPPLVRALLVGICVAIGLALLARAVTMLAAEDPEEGAPRDPNARDIRGMIRAVRLAFLALAAFAAAGAFLVGQSLLLVVAVVIAGVDVIETSFLLLVARTHQGDDRPRS
jgi:hypothetical protein